MNPIILQILDTILALSLGALLIILASSWAARRVARTEHNILFVLMSAVWVAGVIKVLIYIWGVVPS